MIGKVFEKGKIVWLMIIMVGLMAVGCGPKDSKDKDEAKEVPVQVAMVKEGNLEATKEISGKLKAKVDINVIPKTAGQVLELYVKKGDKVKKGQTLAKLDVRDQVTMLEMEKAALQQAKNQLETAKVAERVAVNNLENAKANLIAAEGNPLAGGSEPGTTTVSSENFRIQWEDAKKNRERMETLYEAGAVSLADYERAVSQEKMAQLSYQNGEIVKKQTNLAVANAEENLNQARIAVQQAKVSIQQVELRVKQASDRVNDGLIKAPESGEVTNLNAEVGEMISNQAPFASILSPNSITFEAQLSAEQLKLFNSGEEFEVNVHNIKEKVKATITYVAPNASGAGLYSLEAVIDNSPGNLKSGMVGTIVAKEIKVEGTLLIPTEAIVENGGSTYIFVIENRKAIKKEVTVIESQTIMSAVKGSFKASDRVVVKGQNTLGKGNLVKIIKEER